MTQIINFFSILFYFYTLQNCISFAKYQNESATDNHDGVITHTHLEPEDTKGSKNDHFLYQPLADTELIILNFLKGFSVRG